MESLPKWSEKLLRAICPEELYEQIAGDLIEIYNYEVKLVGKRKAKLQFILSCIRFFRPGIILRNKVNVNFMNFNLLDNYLKVAVRNLSRNKSHSIITIGGLAVGIACSLVIFLFVHREWSYDKGWKNADRTYRVGISFFNIGPFAVSPEALLNVLPKEFAGIETGTRIRKSPAETITIKDNTFVETVYYTDSAFFKVFNYDFVHGNPSKVLTGVNEVVLTDLMAMKFFGKKDVMGEILEIGKSKTTFTVTGVVKTVKFNTTIKEQIWLSNHSLLTNSSVWSSAAFYSYILLKENNTELDLQKALDQLYENHVFPESGKPMGFKTLEQYKASNISVKFHMHRLTDIYLKSKLNFEIFPGGNESNIYIFSGVSLAVLLLAAINFINLSTARATLRAKEVGVRKVMGTLRSKLVGQFLLESVVTSMSAMVIALLLAEIFLKVFEYVTGTLLLKTIWMNPTSVGIFVLFSLIVGLISGLYPAFYLTSFVPVKVLKGVIITRGGSLRNVLVIFQFTISVLLVTGALVVQNQLRFMATKDLGFDQNNVLTIDQIRLLKNSAESFRNELSKEPEVVMSGFHVGEPGSKRIISSTAYSITGMEHPLSINTYSGDEHFLSLHGMRLLKGRDFIGDMASDSSSIIFNEAAIKALNITGDPIGTVINEKQKIIGVVSDFHWESLRTSIAPAAIVMGKEKAELGFKLKEGSVSSFLTKAERKWKQLVPDEPFKFHFLDSNFGELLEKERVFGKALNIFTILSIFISCLGLYGLSAYATEQRTKEIGIRKVMGASVEQIVVMLNRKFTILIVIALAISVPLSIILINKWLQEFAYRVDLNIGIFLLTTTMALLVGWLSVGYHSIKAARINPSSTLRYE